MYHCRKNLMYFLYAFFEKCQDYFMYNKLMFLQLFDFYKGSLSNFVYAAANFFIFLPYFFSIQNLIKTLISPSKGLESRKTIAGFSLSELVSRILFNLISRGIGFAMRISIILFYLLLQSLLILVIPFAFLAFTLLPPL